MRTRLQAELLVRRAGWPALLGAVLACAGLAAHLWWLPAQEQRVKRLETEYRRVITQVAALQVQAPVRDASTLQAERYAAFNATLAPHAKAPELIKTVFAQAQKAGLSLAQAEYRLAENKQGGYLAYQMTLPVKGPYLKLREFIEGVLVEVPTAALEEVSFKRDGIGAASAEARLRLVFYLKDGAP